MRLSLAQRRVRQALMADSDDTLWTAEEAGIVLNAAAKTVTQMPGLIRTEIPGRGSRPMVRYRAADVRRYARECRRTGEDRVA